ncbi:hypothetical protein [Paenibacillus durus]|uniref:hypothetical protein n=1 Tax=Paenibacillus durus TaxID=44251 RepID=UPI00146FD3FA|nr:hypothetical protein [Paenibacillus durus]
MPRNDFWCQFFLNVGLNIFDAAFDINAIVQTITIPFPRTVDFIITTAEVPDCSSFAASGICQWNDDDIDGEQKDSP